MIKLITYFVLFFSLLQLTANAQCSSKNVLDAIVNGDFEQGNDGSFTNQLRDFEPYILNNQPCSFQGKCSFSSPGDYLIDSDYNNLCPSCWDQFDLFKASDNHLAMFIDMPAAKGVTIWQETVNVFQNQTYYFSALFALLDAAYPPSVQLYINDVAQGATFDLSMSSVETGQWFQVTAPAWQSNTTTLVTIKLVSAKDVFEKVGNDLAVDNISFINSCQNISGLLKPNLESNLSMCSIALLDTKIDTPGVDFYWYEGTSENQSAASTTTGTVLNPSTRKSITVNKPGMYRVCVDDGKSCPVSAIVEVTAIEIPTYDTSMVSSKLCYGSLQTFNNLGTGANAINYKWYDAATGGKLLASGASPKFTMPSSGDVFSVYLEEISSATLSGSPLLDEPLTEQSSGSNSVISLTVLSKVNLQSVKVKQRSYTGACFVNSNANVVVELLQNDVVVNAVNSSITCNAETLIPLDFDLFEGAYILRIKGGSNNSNPGFYSTAPQLLPIEIQGYVRVEKGSLQSNNNGPFAALSFNKLNTCERVLVQIPIVDCCSPFTAIASSNSVVCMSDSLKLTCTGSDIKTYNWSGPSGFTSSISNPVIANASLTMAGTYNVTVTNTVNCVKTLSVDVDIHTIDSIVVHDTIIKGDSVLFNGKYITKAGVYSLNTINQLGCDSIVQLNIVLDSTSVYYSVSGMVYAGGAVVETGEIFLLTNDAVKGEKIVKQATIENGLYSFNFVKPNTYTLLAKSLIGDTYLPTYFGDKTKSWQAVFITIYGDVGQADIHLVQQVNTIDEVEQETEFTIFPNPVNQSLAISSKNLDYTSPEVKIINAIGQTVLSYNLQHAYDIIDVGLLSNGLYFVSINGQVQKFVVNR